MLSAPVVGVRHRTLLLALPGDEAAALRAFQVSEGVWGRAQAVGCLEAHWRPGGSVAVVLAHFPNLWSMLVF